MPYLRSQLMARTRAIIYRTPAASETYCSPNPSPVSSHLLLEDLLSADMMGLVQAPNRFDPARNLKFKTLAEHRIRGAMLDYLRSVDPQPRALRRFVRQREAVMPRLKATASEDEVPAAMGVPIERYHRLSQIARSSDAEQRDGSARRADSSPPAATL